MWDMFLSNLNSNLSTINLENFGFMVRYRMFKLLEFINEYSRKLFEPHGVRLALWLLEVKFKLNNI